MTEQVSATAFEGIFDLPLGYERWSRASGPQRYDRLSLKSARILSEPIRKLLGWRVETPFFPFRKAIVIAGPHTSNWDFILLLAVALNWRVTCNWLGKDALFKGPSGPIMRGLGGISIDRSKAGNMVDQAVAALKQADKMLLVITPEGTRGKVERWKSGYYHIAHAADVPIVPVLADYAKRTATVGRIVDAQRPHMEVEADLKKQFSHVTPRNPHRIGKTTGQS